MPKITVFTPSHDPTYLDECWESLAAQTFTDFEWIVLLNHGAKWKKPNDSRIIKSSRPSDLDEGVGALKANLCKHANGDILVELDHDDLLTNNALEVISTTFATLSSEFGLIYSDTAQINADGSRNESKFADGHGWEYYDDTVTAGENDYDVMAFSAKPPTPHNVSYIWYAPNHVRAFRRSTYEAIDGYNKDLAIADDADIICRMYQHSKFLHIPYPLYLQRIHPSNTQSEPTRNADIQVETTRIYDENIQPNALIWAERNSLPCYDLGGAHNCPPGYEPLDIALNGLDILESLRFIPDDSVGIYRAVDFIEHIQSPITLMNELYRTLAPGGMFLSLTPSTDGRGAFCDPTHVSFWNELSFRYYCDTEYQKYVPAITSRFRQSRLTTYFPSPWHEQNNLPYVCCNLTKDP